MAQNDHPWHSYLMDATLMLGQQGRLVIPAEVRSALGLSPGDELHLRMVGHSLVLERPRDAASELRGLASQVPRTRSLVDELLSERRHAAAVGE
jgi:antitoxin PrlF